MSDKYLNEAGLSRLWTKIKASQVETLRPLFEAESFGPAPQVSFSADYGGLPLRKCLVKIQPLQVGSGEPSPENVRPISGWDSVDLVLSPTASAEDGRTISVQLPETVYGGTLDVLSGVLTVDRLGRVFDGTENWSLGEAGTPAMLFRYSDSRGPSESGAVRASSHFPNATIISSTDVIGFYAYTSGGQQSTRLQFRPGLDGVTTVDAWKAWLARQAADGTPLTCWWKIKTPLVYQLRPQMVTALEGQNNIWADCGDVTVENGAFLQALQQEIELLFNANQS